MSVCDDYCRSCFYHAKVSGGISCEYFSITGQRRGCDAGSECDKRMIGQRGSTTNGLFPFALEKSRPPRQEEQSKVIKEFCKEHGITYRQLGAICGISLSTAKKWANGVHHANWDLLAKAGIEKPEGIA